MSVCSPVTRLVVSVDCLTRGSLSSPEPACAAVLPCSGAAVLPCCRVASAASGRLSRNCLLMIAWANA
jgi:hypothetical protein